MLLRVFAQSNLLEKIKTFNARDPGPLSVVEATQYEKLDAIRIQGMVYAERYCRKLKMGGIPWTPELTRIRIGIEVWQLVINRLQGGAVSARTILRKKKKASMERVNTNVTIAFAGEQITDLFREYKLYLTQKGQKRQDFQHSLAIARSKEGNTTVTTEIKRMQRIEKQRASAQSIRRMNGTARTSGGLQKVVVEGTDNQTVELVDKKDMESALLEAYAITLTQANNTPCMRSPLKEFLGAYGTSDNSSRIVQGELLHLDSGTIDQVDNSTLEVLKYLAMKGGRSDHFTPKPLDVVECQQGWKKATERTSSSMRIGTHFGHWKAGYCHDDIAVIHTALANIPFTSGYSPRRWQFGVNSILTKEPGNFKINRLRTILLYEADYNFNNKILGR